MIHDSEAEVELAKMHFEKARDKLSSLKLKLRDKQLEGKGKILKCQQNFSHTHNQIAASHTEITRQFGPHFKHD